MSTSSIYIPSHLPTPVVVLLVLLELPFTLASAVFYAGDLAFTLLRLAVTTAFSEAVFLVHFLMVIAIEVVGCLPDARSLVYSCACGMVLSVVRVVQALLGLAKDLAFNLLFCVARLSLLAARSSWLLVVCIVQVLLVVTHDLAIHLLAIARWVVSRLSSALACTLTAVVWLVGRAASLAWFLLVTRWHSAAKPSPCLAPAGRSFRSDRALVVSVADSTYVPRTTSVSMLPSLRSVGRALASMADTMDVVRETVMSRISSSMDLVRDAVLSSIAGRPVFVSDSMWSGMRSVRRSSAFSFADGMSMDGWSAAPAVLPSTLGIPSGMVTHGPLAHLTNDASAGFSGLEVFGELGSGGFGVVHLVREIGSATLKAAKVLDRKVGSALHLLRNEIYVHSLVSHSLEGGCHPNIVRLDHVIENMEKVTLVMEHCSGGTLSDLSSRLGNEVLTDAAVAGLLLPVARGLAHLHSVGVAHRDLKMENILLDASGTPKIADFGLATRERRCHGRAGTTHVMPPELINRQSGSPAYDPCKSDIWALGIVFWELKFRQLPWRAASYAAQDHFQDFLDSQRSFLASEPGMELDSLLLLLGLLRLDPQERFSAQEAVRRLEEMARSG